MVHNAIISKFREPAYLRGTPSISYWSPLHFIKPYNQASFFTCPAVYGMIICMPKRQSVLNFPQFETSVGRKLPTAGYGKNIGLLLSKSLTNFIDSSIFVERQYIGEASCTATRKNTHWEISDIVELFF